MYKMKKLTALFTFLFLTAFCFANGRCDRLEREIMKNSNVFKVTVVQYDKWTQEIYYADIYLKNDGYLLVDEFDRYLSGNNLNVLYIGRDAEGKIEYEFVGFRGVDCIELSGLLNKEIRNVNDIINNYDEIYKLAEALAKETPEERTKRMKMERTDPDFTEKLGNFDNGKYWGCVFARKYQSPLDKETEPIFATE